MFMNRQEKGQLDKKRIEEIVNYLLENFSTTIVGKYSSVNGINLDLNDEDDDYIVDIRQDIDALNAVLKGINKKTTDNLKSKISKFMNIKSKTTTYNKIGAFKIYGLYEFPVELYNFKNLTMLQLIGGDISEIPEDINNLSNLLEFKIVDCQNIYELPNSLTSMNNLMLFEISGTNILKLPEDIGNLPRLRQLILENNPNLDTLPESLIENRNNITIKTDYSDFYKNKMVLENISDTNKSTIVLAINGHGLDLCDTPLDTNLNKLLYFSYAPKYNVSLMNRKCPTSNKIINLMDELNRDKIQISNVIEKLENISSDVYDVRDRHDILNQYDELTEERNEELIRNRNILLENEANLVFKVRAIKNDHSYDFHGDENEEWEGKYGIYILDIRNPKNEIQNNYKLISKDLNSSKLIELSDVLNICYVNFGFDYVAIIDTSCRTSSTEEEPMCNIENIYKKRSEQLGEIMKGREPLKKFKEEKLGGKKNKKNKKNKSNKRNRNNSKKIIIKNNNKKYKLKKSVKKRRNSKTRKI
jgi:hypothetical protein